MAALTCACVAALLPRSRPCQASASCFGLQGFPERDGIFPRVNFAWIEGDPSSLDALQRARLQDANAVVIGGGGSGPAKEADAFTLTTITLAQVPFCLPWSPRLVLWTGPGAHLSGALAPPSLSKKDQGSQAAIWLGILAVLLLDGAGESGPGPSGQGFQTSLHRGFMCFDPPTCATVTELIGMGAAQEVLLKAGRDEGSPAHVVGLVRQPETVEVANWLIDRMGPRRAYRRAAAARRARLRHHRAGAHASPPPNAHAATIRPCPYMLPLQAHACVRLY